jgi:hypothetical protein
LKKPPEMVLATSVDRQAPTRLRTAARVTAVRGLRAPVAIGPAMAFALSWNHLLQRARYRRQPRLDSRTIARVNGR